MRPPACVACKWGQGTTCSEKKSNTAAVQEMEKRLAELQAERKKQENQWVSVSNDPKSGK